MQIKKNKNKKSAFTLIEALVFLFIFSIITITFYQSWVVATRAIIDSKKKAGAVALANERMEEIRNMSYENIGTVGGDVEGDLLQDETGVSKSGVSYSVHTDVGVVNDAFDNNPDDANPIDYKKVTIKVTWENGNESKSATLISTFAPPGIEDVFTGGILKLKVVDSGGNPISLVWVHIKNSSTSPILDTYKQTDVNGEIWLYESDPSLETYEITVSPEGKDSFGYFQVMTFARTATFEPDDVHGSVIGGVINSKTIKTDKVSDLDLHLRDPLDNVVQNENFDLKGGREKGYDSTLPGERYYFEENNTSSGSDGDISFDDQSFGSYFFIYPDDDPDYKFLWIDQSTDTPNKFDLSPNTSADIFVRLADKDLASLLVKVVDKNDGTPIADAEVTATDGTANLSAQTNQYGYAYFPDSDSGLTELADGEYTVEATKDGDSENNSIEISGNLAEITLEL